MIPRKNRPTRANCPHTNQVTIRNAGIERTVCESCGNVSLRALDPLSGSVDRSRFERQVERTR